MKKKRKRIEKIIVKEVITLFMLVKSTRKDNIL
jgi:hypothetical protein